MEVKRKLGGISEEKQATPEEQKIYDEVKHDVEEKTGRKFTDFVAKAFSTQVVGGKNYFIKVNVGGEEFVHLRVHKSLPQKGNILQLHSFQVEKSDQDPIKYF